MYNKISFIKNKMVYSHIQKCASYIKKKVLHQVFKKTKQFFIKKKIKRLIVFFFSSFHIVREMCYIFFYYLKLP
jgi:hypothetical protein